MSTGYTTSGVAMTFALWLNSAEPNEQSEVTVARVT
jgi:hypothetical protein